MLRWLSILAGQVLSLPQQGGNPLSKLLQLFRRLGTDPSTRGGTCRDNHLHLEGEALFMSKKPKRKDCMGGSLPLLSSPLLSPVCVTCTNPLPLQGKTLGRKRQDEIHTHTHTHTYIHIRTHTHTPHNCTVAQAGQAEGDRWMETNRNPQTHTHAPQCTTTRREPEGGVQADTR